MYINIHVSSPLHRPPAGNIRFMFKGVNSRNDVDAKPVCFFVKVAPTALGPISSCRASETNGE